MAVVHAEGAFVEIFTLQDAIPVVADIAPALEGTDGIHARGVRVAVVSFLRALVEVGAVTPVEIQASIACGVCCGVCCGWLDDGLRCRCCCW